MTAQDYRKRAIICFILAMICLFGPLLFYFAKAFVLGTTFQKATLCFTLVVSGIFTVINLSKKAIPKSVIWIVLLGIHYVFASIYSIVLVFAITTILEEVVFTPLHKYYAAKYREEAQTEKIAKKVKGD